MPQEIIGDTSLTKSYIPKVLSRWQKEYNHHWKPNPKRSTGIIGIIMASRNWNEGASWYDIFETASVEFEFPGAAWSKVDVMYSRKPKDRTPPTVGMVFIS
ncbi:hypothetical protein Tco_0913369 [Tanacetum coccineum]